MHSLKPVIGLVVSVVVVFGVAAIGGSATASSVGSWFETLKKPSFNPPSWVFGPVWTALYLMMAVAAWLVWLKHGFAGAEIPLAVFGLQLALNGAWSVLFFAMRSPGLAFVEILLLWALILVTTVLFWRLRPLAGILLVPYLLWVSFASVLNGAIWALNR